MAQDPIPREPRQSIQKRKGAKLMCPCCGFRVGDASQHTKMTIWVAGDDPLETADLYIKCGRCKSELAARKIE